VAAGAAGSLSPLFTFSPFYPFGTPKAPPRPSLFLWLVVNEFMLIKHQRGQLTEKKWFWKYFGNQYWSNPKNTGMTIENWLREITVESKTTLLKGSFKFKQCND